MGRTAEEIAAEALAKTKSKTDTRWKGSKDLEKLLIPIGFIHPDPENENVHSQSQIERMTISLAEHGQPEALSVVPYPEKGDGHMKVVVGHARLQAADILGWTHLACAEYTGDPKKAEAYRIASNKLQSMSKLDEEKVLDTIDRHREETDNFNPELFGYSKEELEKVEAKLTTDADDQEPIDVDDEEDEDGSEDEPEMEKEDASYPSAAETLTLEFDNPEQRETFIKFLDVLDRSLSGLSTRGERLIYYIRNAGSRDPGFNEDDLSYTFKFDKKKEFVKFAQFMAALKSEFGGGNDYKSDAIRIFAFIDDNSE